MADILSSGVPVKPVAQNYHQAFAHIAALTGTDPNTTIVNFRCIHDAIKNAPAHSYDGTLPQLWKTFLDYQARGHGVFLNVNQLDGNGRELANVQFIRAHVVDLDNLSAAQNFERAAAWFPSPSFAVQTSPSKYHCYWPVTPYRDNDRYTLIQRKLRQLFDGDKSVIDPTRMLRLAGTLHLKDTSAPHLVQCWSLAGHGYQTPPEALEGALASVNVIDGVGGRHELGEPSLAAPSLDWIRFALKLLDPNDLDRGDWISFSAAVKQAGWTLTDPDTLFHIWSDWCARYNTIGHDGKPRVNDPGENLKQWLSFRNTEVGWPSIERRVPSLLAYRTLATPPAQTALAQPAVTTATLPTPPMPAPPELDCSGEMLTHMEQQQWFKGCVLIGPENRIIGPRGIRYDVGSFNASYGGKRFIIDALGKVTDEAWKAATRSTLWTVPKVDGTCFRPDLPTGEITGDGLGRSYLNTYVPARIETLAGDPTPFLRHLALVLPNADDQRILIEFLAHNARYPGHKIPWAPVIQSVEGVGKNVFKHVIRHVIDKQYFYQPKAKQLNDSGSKFNGWMDSKLFFLVDEIKVDERRDMVETLKPFVTETELEIEGKGANQRMADTPSNWMFFSNHKDAIPINANARRFAIFFSPIQTLDDLRSRGMDDTYFNSLYAWLGDHQNGAHRMGLRIVANYLLTYPIERGALPTRAPITSSTAEALIESRGWLETMIAEAVDDQRNGFRAGWINTAALAALLREQRKDVKPRTIGDAIRALGYRSVGQAGRGYFQDDVVFPNRRGRLWNIDPLANVANYGRSQSYE
ncbi:DUF5906 domain-containing protein [Mesorhizobium sp. B4-1-4]|uniref:DUF5906 domain-containing protein n=1 Tax=Mesorhizobium sp. B4-1-4 TaxID=2589888 RepID=UPI0015E3F4C3|nr:DUF5906 domain-containing protein [Mesorhizobium sp. B4-1-4]UCI30514.1 RepB family DNA primase [Mesorhizobium sp. B4-1-4]